MLPCPECSGSGKQVTFKPTSPIGWLENATALEGVYIDCSECQGTGQWNWRQLPKALIRRVQRPFKLR